LLVQRLLNDGSFLRSLSGIVGLSEMVVGDGRFGCGIRLLNTMTIARNSPCSVCSPSRWSRFLGQAVRTQSSLFRIAKASRSGRSSKDVTEVRRAINFTITYQRSTHVHTWREDVLCIDSRKSCQGCEVRSDGVALQISNQRQYTMFEQASNNLKRVTSQVGWRL